LVVTGAFDPLRDEGIAYGEVLASGVPVEQRKARGHFHASFTMVDVVITGVSGRTQMAEALGRFAGLQGSRQPDLDDTAARHSWRIEAARERAGGLVANTISFNLAPGASLSTAVTTI
jgi:acetyl esterase/lipase